MSELQLFEALDPATEAALRASIDRFGVLVPVVRDQTGRTLDGHHRSRIADELGVKYRVDIVSVADEAEAEAIARTLNTDRRHLTVEQRREVVSALREQGHSLRAIAGAVGVDPKTVRNDLSGGDISPPERAVGTDGKSYPAKRPNIIAAKDTREAKRAQAALSTAPPLPAGRTIDTKRVERIAREHQAQALRDAPILRPEADADGTQILHGNFSDVLSQYDIPGAVIISDPPYPREHLDLYDELAAYALAADIKRMVLMVGQTILPDVLARVTPWQWHYRWCGAYLTPGPATRVWNARIGSAWKPILVFEREDAEPEFVTRDVFQSSGDDKRFHHWGQDEVGMAQLVEAFTETGDLVCDPFLGGGTTAVVCRDLGRSFIGSDIDAAAIASTLERLA